MRYNKRYLCLPAAALLALLFSCRRESLHEEASGPLRFAVTEAAPDWSTKASTPLDGAPISVWAYNMPATDSPVGAWLLDGGSPSAVTASYSGSYWKPASSIPFNSSGRAASWYARWFAVAPQPAAGNGITLGGIAAGTAPTLSFTVPAAAASQPDLVAAVTEPIAIGRKEVVPLAFRHVLTGIRLVTDATANLTAATLSGVYGSASLNLLTKEWSGHAGVGSYDFDFTSPSPTLMMLPQWLPAGAKLSYTIDGITVEADLSGHEWKMGKLVTYRIEGPEYQIEVVEMTDGLSATIAGNAPWKVKGVYSTQALAEAGGTPDLDGSWTVTKEGNSLSVTAPAASTVSKTVTALLQEAAEQGTSAHPWNLSNRAGWSDKIEESANSYIINAPGWYRIPLVAGNGVKNNLPNTAAYPSNFVDYKGAAFTSPYLHKSSAGVGTPTSGGIVWTETSGMVENLSVEQDDENDLYWLTFNVQPSKIAQGCTVVSVKDGAGTVMWSWLLWFTDMEAGAGDVACTNATFMPRNLGWSVDGTLTGVKPAASAFVRVEVEADSDTYAVVMVRRAAELTAALPHAGHGPLFQWGRKDAMPHSAAAGWAYRDSGAKRPEELIKDPGKHFITAYYPFITDGGGFTASNWWSAAANAAQYNGATVKTVYDPCPAGYTVPRHEAFNDFSASSATWDDTAKGYSFTLAGGSLYFPAQGQRNAGATSAAIPADHVGKGRYWTAVAQGGNTGRRMSFSSGSVGLPADTGDGRFNKAGEHSIRPAREE